MVLPHTKNVNYCVSGYCNFILTLTLCIVLQETIGIKVLSPLCIQKALYRVHICTSSVFAVDELRPDMPLVVYREDVPAAAFVTVAFQTLLGHFSLFLTYNVRMRIAILRTFSS